MSLPGFGFAELYRLGYLSLAVDGLGGHGGPGPLVRGDHLAPTEQIKWGVIGWWVR